MASKANKFLKKYERHFLIGLVVLLLATFSVTGAVSQCGSRTQDLPPLGGSFEGARGAPRELSDKEFVVWANRYHRVVTATHRPTREFLGYIGGAPSADPDQAAWMHILACEAARGVGYAVGEQELRQTLLEILDSQRRGKDVLSSEALYREFLREEFRGTQAEFEETTREIALKDRFIAPLAYAARFSQPWGEAYEDWKDERERVNLAAWSVPAAAFEERARQQEASRRELGRQEEALTRLADAVRTLERFALRLHGGREEGSEKAPSVEEVFGSSAPPQDPWGEPFRYDQEQMTVSSAGADGDWGTVDDLTSEVRRELKSHAAVLRAGRALRGWRNAMNAWPEALARLVEKPKPDLPAPLRDPKALQDGWDRDLMFESQDEDSARVVSVGADGRAGTDDDVVGQVDGDLVKVSPQGSLRAYVLAELRDAWDRPLAIHLDDPDRLTFRVVSAGEDGQLGTADDLDQGNSRQMRGFYADPVVRERFYVPARNTFSSLYVHLPLLSDDLLRRLWERFPEQRPTSEEKIFRHWKELRSSIYVASDPADPQDGHGSGLAARVAPAAPVNLVPAAGVFPATLDAGVPEGPAEEEALRKTFVEKGWRQIVIRDVFVEALLASLLEKMVEREEEIAQWEKQYGLGSPPAGAGEPAGDEAESERKEGDSSGASGVPPKPLRLTFETLLAEDLADFVPTGASPQGERSFEVFRTEKPLTRDEWVEVAPFDDPAFSRTLLGLGADGELAPIPVQLHGRLTKALVRNLHHEEGRQPDLEEVGDAVFDAYAQRRALDLAADALEGLRKEILAAEEKDPEGGLATAVGSWSSAHGVAPLEEETGPFVGTSPPNPLPVEAEGLEAEERLRRERLAVLWDQGYEAVRRSASQQDTTSPEPGSFGRQILRDGVTTHRAYLVRVRSHAFPPPEEFTPARYVEYLRQRAYGNISRQERRLRLSDRPGTLYHMLGRFFDDFAWMQEAFRLEIHGDIHLVDPDAP